MQFFVDTAEVLDLRTPALAGLVDGVTTSPSLTAGSGRRITEAGHRTCRVPAGEGTMVNVTPCFSAAQALLAAKPGSTFVFPFVGRLDDIATDGMRPIADMVQIDRNDPALKTEVPVASISHPIHLGEAAKLAAVATLPPALIRQLLQHPLTDKGLAAFLEDWRKTGQSIL